MPKSVFVPLCLCALVIGLSLLGLSQTSTDEQLVAAEKAIDAKDYPAALATLQQVVAKEPSNSRAQFDIAYAYTLMGERAKAIDAYRKTLSIAPNLTQASVNLALLLLEEKQVAEAARLLSSAAAARPKDARVQLLLANALAENGQSAEAAEQYGKVLALEPKSYEACLGLGRVLEWQQHYPEAEQQFTRAFELQPGDVPARLELAALWETTGRKDDAVRLYSELAKVQPDNAAVHRRLGELLLSEKRYREAAAELEAAAKLAPAPNDEWNLARAYAGAKQPAHAIPLLRKIAAGNPADYDAHLLLGEMLTSVRDFAAARQELVIAAGLRPEVPDAWVDLANALYLQGDLPATVAALDRVAKIGRKSPWYYFLRAITLDKLDQPQDALESYQQFLAVANGAYPDQEFQARQRIKAIKLRLEKGGGPKRKKN